jgi:outer membrane protein assembly complex protein YaeT
LQTDYDAEGFPDASVSWWLEPAGNVARAVFEIREGSQPKVGRIHIEGNLLTRSDVIRREIPIREGDPFRLVDLTESQRRIRELGLFRSVIVRGERSAQEEVGSRDVLVRVEEKLNLDLAIGLGFDNEEGARGSFSIGNRNIRGSNISASLQLRYSGLDRIAQVLGGQKRFLGSGYDFLTTAGFREEERPDFTVERIGGSLQLGRPLGKFNRGRYRYRIQNVKLKDLFIPVEDTGETEGILANVGFGFDRDRRNDPMSPRGGSFTGLDFDVYSKLVGSEVDYTRLFTQYSRFWPFGRRPLVFGTSIRLGSQWPFADTERIPVSEHFLAGGVTTVRGYDRNSLGPRNPITGEPIGGDALMILNQELRAPLVSAMEGILFVDSGNVFDRPSDLDPTDLKWTAGLGLGVSTPVGPLRFYYGWKLNRDPDDPETGRFNFMFGPTF